MNKLSLDDLKNKLDEFVVGLDEQKEQLLSIYMKHYCENRNYEKGHRRTIPLLVGPSGSGKTQLVQMLATITHRPFFSISCATVTAEGYKGNNLSQYLGQFFDSLDGNERRFNNSILFLDEFDKLITNTYKYKNASITDQQAFLNLFDSDTYTISSEKTPVTLNTSNMLIILAGAFTGLKDLMKDNKSTFGLVREEETPSNPQEQALQLAYGLKEFGFIDEIIGRISMCIEFPKPTEKLMMQILNSDNSSLGTWKKYFNDKYSVALTANRDARQYISRLTVQTPFGVRGITHFLNPLLNQAIVSVERDSTISKISVKYNDEQGLYLEYTHSNNLKKVHSERGTLECMPSVKGLNRLYYKYKNYYNELNFQVDEYTERFYKLYPSIKYRDLKKIECLYRSVLLYLVLEKNVYILCESRFKQVLEKAIDDRHTKHTAYTVLMEYHVHKCHFDEMESNYKNYLEMPLTIKEAEMKKYILEAVTYSNEEYEMKEKGNE